VNDDVAIGHTNICTSAVITEREIIGASSIASPSLDLDDAFGAVVSTVRTTRCLFTLSSNLSSFLLRLMLGSPPEIQELSISSEREKLIIRQPPIESPEYPSAEEMRGRIFFNLGSV